MINNTDKDLLDKDPVGWLAGRELLAGLKWIAAYSLMGDKLDPKDWMSADVIEPPCRNIEDDKTYWFDFIADTGDGAKAVYYIAQLCMSNLWLNHNAQPGTEGGKGKDAVSLRRETTGHTQLPRGEFLFIGGDIAYHIADLASLRERFQTPFNLAFDHLSAQGVTIDRRPIYGIPANHDYYDALDGFNRQLIKPITQDTFGSDEDPAQPQLALKGYYRSQSASYVALKLPHDWFLCGFDSQLGRMDKRQQAFFASTFVKNPELLENLFDKDFAKTIKKFVPRKLIVVTPEPTTVFGQWARPDADIAKTFQRLGLEPSFLENNGGKLDSDYCRLDLSGDIHHYERYWGSEPGAVKPVNYASVVAGGGGAFLHPSHTDLNKAVRKWQYPSRKDSHKHVIRRILNPLNIFNGGYLWLVGAVVALLNVFAVTIPESTWSLFKLLPNDSRPLAANQGGFLARIQRQLDISLAQANNCCSPVYFLDLIYILLFAGFMAYWVYQTPTYFKQFKYADCRLWRQRVWRFVLPVAVCFIPMLELVFWPRERLPESLLAGGLIDLFVIAAILLFALSRRYTDLLIERARFHRETMLDRAPLWIFNIMAVVFAGFGFLYYGVYQSSVMIFDLLIGLVWLLCTLGLMGFALISGAMLYLPSYRKEWRTIARFAGIGLWHGALQLAVPVCMVLYLDWLEMAAICLLVYIVAAGISWLVTSDHWIKDFSLEQQRKIGNQILVFWVIFAAALLGFICRGEPIPISEARLFVAAPLLGAFFSCVWFGWYLAVSLAYHGHNNEAGGGSCSQNYRHMIRFKLTDKELTGYVIGIDDPVETFAHEQQSGQPPKFRLVDVFTIASK